MPKFIYNNVKNLNTNNNLFELNCGYFSYIFYEKEIDRRSNSKLMEKILFKFCKLISTYCENF